jgi:hypothetical protein
VKEKGMGWVGVWVDFYNAFPTLYAERMYLMNAVSGTLQDIIIINWATLGAVRSVRYPSKMADNQPPWVIHILLPLTVKSSSTASQNEKSTHCRCWGLNM